jgi:hypothetical protein
MESLRQHGPFSFFARFPLLNGQTASIIEHSGYHSSEAATPWLMLSSFVARGLGCYAETI